MKKYILFVTLSACFIFNYNAFAQSGVFSKTYSNPSYWLEGKSFVQTTNNTYMVAGAYGYLLKLDSAGTLLWGKKIGDPYLTFKHIIETKDTNYLIVGDNYNLTDSMPTIVCIKVNSSGDTIWSKEFTQSSNSYSLSVIETYDNGFVISGYLDFATPPYTKMLLIKIDSMGITQWSNVISNGNWENYSYDVQQTPDSGYVINSLTVNDTGLDFAVNAALTKLNSSGNVVWSNTYSHATTPTNTMTTSMEVTPAGIVTTLAILPGNDLVIMKTDFLGNVIWSNSYNNLSANGLDLNTTKPPIHRTSDGGYVALTANLLRNTILKIDSLGNVQWNRDFEAFAIDVIQTSDLGYAILASGIPGSLLNSLIVVMKTDSLGNGSTCIANDSTYSQIYSLNATPISTTQYADGSSANYYPLVSSFTIYTDTACFQNFDGINENLLGNISVYPNPSTSFFTFSGLQGKCSIEIYDVTGKIILTEITSEEKMNINLDSQSKGIYFYRVIEKNNNIRQGKISLQ